MYFLPVIIISILFGLFTPGISDAYIWRCHTPQGDIWTEQPNGNADCQEYDGMYNPSPAPSPVQSDPPQYVPTPPPVVVSPPPVVYAPYPYPYYPPQYYYYAGPRVYVGPPLFGFRFNFGGHVGRHFGGHHR